MTRAPFAAVVATKDRLSVCGKLSDAWVACQIGLQSPAAIMPQDWPHPPLGASNVRARGAK